MNKNKPSPRLYPFLARQLVLPVLAVWLISMIKPPKASDSQRKLNMD